MWKWYRSPEKFKFQKRCLLCKQLFTTKKEHYILCDPCNNRTKENEAQESGTSSKDKP